MAKSRTLTSLALSQPAGATCVPFLQNDNAPGTAGALIGKGVSATASRRLLLDLAQKAPVFDAHVAVDIKGWLENHPVHVDVGGDGTAHVHIGAEAEMHR